MDHQVSPEPENGHSEEETSDLENGSKEDAKQSSLPAKLFTFSIVNSYGTANISPLPCDGNVLKLNRQCYTLRFTIAFSFLIFPSHFVLTRLLPLFSLQHIPQWQLTGTRSQRSCVMMNRKQRSVV